MAYVKAWGFDYDFTLAQYNDNLSVLVYDNVKRYLGHSRGYPKEILDLQFDPNFGIRGLFFDRITGLFLKTDQYGKIQTSCVFRGRTPLSIKEVVSVYPGATITNEIRERCVFFSDFFASPEICLLADVFDILLKQGLSESFHAECVQRDIREAVEYMHAQGVLHKTVIDNPSHFISPNPGLGPLLMSLRDAGKQPFLITNSSYNFVNAGMTFMLKDFLQEHNIPHWRDLFDWVVCSSKKPYFYNSSTPFRRFLPNHNTLSLDSVSELKRGEVYVGGGMKQFMKLTGLKGREVLYVGDHVINDLAQPSQCATWRTCAVVRELDRELTLMQEPTFNDLTQRLFDVESLITTAQQVTGMENEIQTLKTVRNDLRAGMRSTFNSNFGSVFRTNTNNSRFFYELCQFADIYTSDPTNFLSYSHNHTFYALRTSFPHEVPMMWQANVSLKQAQDALVGLNQQEQVQVQVQQAQAPVIPTEESVSIPMTA